MSALDALGEYSSDGSAAASNLRVLSDNSQDDSIDDDDCVMQAADAAPPVKQKIFLKQSSLQNFFKPSAQTLSVGEKVSHAIDSERSKIMKPKERLATWTNHISDKDRIRRKKAEQRRRDAARSLLDARIEQSARKHVDQFTKTTSAPVDVESAVKETVRDVRMRNKKKKSSLPDKISTKC